MNSHFKDFQKNYEPPTVNVNINWWDQNKQPETTTVVDDEQGKVWYRSKCIWASIVFFLISLLTVVGTFPQVLENPIAQGIIGMAFSVLWIIFRMVTDQPISPQFNLPNPADMWRKKQQQ